MSHFYDSFWMSHWSERIRIHSILMGHWTWILSATLATSSASTRGSGRTHLNGRLIHLVHGFTKNLNFWKMKFLRKWKKSMTHRLFGSILISIIDWDSGSTLINECWCFGKTFGWLKKSNVRFAVHTADLQTKRSRLRPSIIWSNINGLAGSV